MFLLLFILWVIFNGKVTVEILLLGLGICGWLYWFMCKYMGYSPKKEKEVLKRIPQVTAYFFVLISEIFKGGFAVIRIILSPNLEIEPSLITFQSDLKSETARVALANSITLTPGTYTIQLEDNTLLVHILDTPFGEDIESSVFIKQLRKLEG